MYQFLFLCFFKRYFTRIKCFCIINLIKKLREEKTNVKKTKLIFI